MHRTAVTLIAVITMIATGTPGFAQEATGPTTKVDTLKVDPLVDGTIAATSVTAWVVWGLLDTQLAPKTCRWCSTNRLDAGVRNALVWSNPGAAETISTVIAITVTAGSGAYTLLHTYSVDGTTEAVESGVVWAEALGVTGVLTSAAKYTFARSRPHAYYGKSTGAQDNLSFWSGHASTVFSAVAATGTLARLRLDDAWPWLYVIGFTSAASQIYFRVSGDQHWITDTLTGAAVGTALGIVIPWLHRSGAGRVTFQIVPTGDGLAVAGQF